MAGSNYLSDLIAHQQDPNSQYLQKSLPPAAQKRHETPKLERLIKRQDESGFSWNDFPDNLKNAGVTETENGDPQISDSLEQSVNNIALEDENTAPGDENTASGDQKIPTGTQVAGYTEGENGRRYPIYHASDGHRYTGDIVPDDFFRREGSWTTSPRQPLDIPPGISVGEGLDNWLKERIKNLPGTIVRPTTPREEVHQNLINNGNFCDGFNAHWAETARARTPRPGKFGKGRS
ncbi:hypothetical protein EYZ11_011850 [Aspergillus tanneri]|uniref:Uncharacterized protein n=1 Tax=Aspergillus tanneri TaxID=1220188 RepID=A0A4V3UMV2_9EURO|nr:uncharacterized protein ATNIH1004_005259 [Aspergillus tanneri]KAA8649358.1 hypothetical protein ATNIH1004_005259 [Aspergillus tanneri]THC88704.1 hypothetical protein EYZ11_011850 [Aspergillus tanneri]